VNRKQLEHIIRAACTVADDDELNRHRARRRRA
jgi:hypothetical protein